MIATAPFGRTGHDSSRVIFGAAALGSMRQENADEILELLLRHGVNHIDTAASYGDSELRIGSWLAEHRQRFFVATKTGERTGDGARAELERSLERLRVDAVDMIQLHNLVEEDEWSVAHGPAHSYVALADRDYRRDVEALIDTCAARGVAVQTIKAIARRRWPDDHDGRKFSWYEPLPDGDALRRAVQWVLADDRVFLNSSSDARRLPAILDAAAAHDGRRPHDETMAADAAALDAAPLFDGAALERI